MQKVETVPGFLHGICRHCPSLQGGNYGISQSSVGVAIAQDVKGNKKGFSKYVGS